MMAYASQTGTRRNVKALQDSGWGFILSPMGGWTVPAGMPYMLDNGEWSRFQIAENQRAIREEGDRLEAGKKVPTLTRPRATSVDPLWPEELELEEAIELKFTRMLDQMAAGADSIIVPDRVAHESSLDRSLQWLEPLAAYGRPLLLPVQNGMTPDQIRPLLGMRTFDTASRLQRERGVKRPIQIPVGIFLGGSTDWKEETMQEWGNLARELGCPYHVGRVNTHRRMRMALKAGATSIDGSCATRYATKLPALDLARRGYHWTAKGQILMPGLTRPDAPARPEALSTKDRTRAPKAATLKRELAPILQPADPRQVSLFC